MVFLDDLKDLVLYKKPFVLPINEKNIKKGSAIYLISPNLSTSTKIMNAPYLVNKMSIYQSYYLEKNANYYINKEGFLQDVDDADEFLCEVGEDDVLLAPAKKLEDKEVQNMELYFLSDKYMDGVKLEPRVPDNELTRNGYEDNTTPRTPFCTTIEGCLASFGENVSGKQFYVYQPEEEELEVWEPNERACPDAKVTGEKWVLKQVQLKCIGKIKCLSTEENTTSVYTYGNQHSNSFNWNFKWIEKEGVPVQETTIFNEANSRDQQKYQSNFKKKKTDKKFKYLSIKSPEALPYLEKDKFCKSISKSFKDYNGEIAVEGGNVAGYVFVGDKVDKGFIHSLRVYPPYRGCGVGSKLLDIAITKYGGYDLTVDKDNELAIDIYKRKGFAIDNSRNARKKMHYMVLKSHQNESAVNEKYSYFDSGKFKKVPKNVKLYHGSRTQNLKEITPKKNESISRIGKVSAIYASKDKRFAACYGTEWRDDIAKQGSWDNWNTVVMGISDKVNMDSPCSLYELENDGSFVEISTKEVVSTNTIKVIKEHKYSSYKDMLIQNGVKMISYDNYMSNINNPNPKFNYLNQESVVQEAIKLPITLYHGSVMLYDELKSTGIDLGNAIQKPGWSLFCWTKYDYAIGWGVFGVLKKLAKNYDDINVLCCGNSHIPYITKSSYEKLINVLQSIPDNLKTYYVYTIKPDKKYEYGFGHSSNTPNCITIRNCSIKPYKVDKRVLSINDLQKYCKIVPDDYEPTKDDNGFDKRILSFLMTNDYTRNFKNKKQLSDDIEKGLLQVGDDIQEYMDRNGIELNKVSIYDRFKNESVVQEAARSKLPESEFGVPSKRKFPLDSAQHVKSAIRFFNYVEQEDEAELAKRIKKKAKEFGVPIRCGKKNRLSKYISKEYVNEFMAASAIGNDAYAVINGSIKQAAYQNGFQYTEDDEYPYTKKKKAKIHKNNMMKNDFTEE